MSAKLMPLFLLLEGRDVLVVGAGAVATRKIAELVEAGAKVRVVAPEATDEVKALAAKGTIALESRAFDDRDADGAWLVIAATSDESTQSAVAFAAEARRCFVIAVDDKTNTSAYGAATIRRGPITIAISSSGEAPALTRLLREIFEQAIPEQDWIDVARALRETWKRDGTPMGSRFAELVRAFKSKAG